MDTLIARPFIVIICCLLCGACYQYGHLHRVRRTLLTREGIVSFRLEASRQVLEGRTRTRTLRVLAIPLRMISAPHHADELAATASAEPPAVLEKYPYPSAYYYYYYYQAICDA